MQVQTLDEAIESAGEQFIVFGHSGTGKTMLISTLEGNILVIASEKGLSTLKNLPEETKERISVVSVTCMKEMSDAFDAAKNGIDLGDMTMKCFDWVVVDSLTEVADFCLQEEMKKTDHGMQAYGKLAEKIRNMIKYFVALPSNLLLICHQDYVDVSGGNGVKKQAVSMPGQQLNKIPHLVNHCLQAKIIEDEEGQYQYVLQTNSDNKVEAKHRGGTLELYEQPNLTTIINKLNGVTKDV